MQCAACGSGDSKVLESRATPNNSIRRRRECAQCKARWWTQEVRELVLAKPPPPPKPVVAPKVRVKKAVVMTVSRRRVEERAWAEDYGTDFLPDA